MNSNLMVVTMGEQFDRMVRIFPNKIAIVGKQDTLSYKKLDQKSTIFAKYLFQHGVTEGDRVGIRFENKINWVIGMLGLVKLGAAYVPLSTKDSQEYIELVTKDVEVKLICSDLDTYSGELEYLNIQQIFDAPYNDEPLPIVTSKAPGYVMFTSGTTGNPKGVAVTQKNILNLVVNPDCFDFDENTILLQTGSITFDASTFEVWGPLLNGGTLVLAETNRITDYKYLKQEIRKYDINVMWLTAPLFKIISRKEPNTFKGIQQLIVGGDVVEVMDVNRVLERVSGINIYNGYGPTECTTFSTMYKLSEPFKGTTLPIGSPIDNVEAYIVDNDLNLVTDNVVGELLIGGNGVSQGYINRTELNKTAFIQNPYGSGKLYRTGDLVQQDKNGILTFRGRMDRQVKIRGYRIELDAVEAMLNQLDSVNNAAVCCIVNEKKDDSKEICAYVSSSDENISEIGKEKILNDFRSIAPNQIVLSHLYVADKLPLNKNGKVDYGIIKQHFESSLQNDLPGNKVSFNFSKFDLLVSILEEHTGNVVKNGKTSFFELGLDSLTAVYVAYDIESKFGITISPIDILMNATIDSLLKFIEDSRVDNKNTQISDAIVEELPLSNYQRPIFIDFNKYQKSVRYNIPFLAELSNNIDIEKLNQSLIDLVDMYDGLRTHFTTNDGKVRQSIIKKIDVQVERVNGMPNLDELIRPFDLMNDLLFRFTIIFSNERRWLFMDFHHIVVDGASLENILDSLNNLYEDKHVKMPQNNILAWMKTAQIRFDETKDSNVKYWTRRFKDFEGMQELPVDNDKVGLDHFKNAKYDLILDANLVEQLRNWCKKMNITTYEGASLAYAAMLAIITGSEQTLFATPARDYAENLDNHSVAMLTNTLWILSELRDEDTIYTFANRFIRDFREAEKHKNVPFEDIHDLMGNTDDVTDTLIAYHKLKSMDTVLFNDDYIAKPIPPKDGMFPINVQMFDDGESLTLECEYYVDLFANETIQGLISIYCRTIKQITSNSESEVPLKNLLFETIF